MGLPVLDGFTTTEMLIAITTAGFLGTTVTPQIISMVDRADQNSLEYARSALHSAVQTMHMVGLVKHSSHIEVEGKIVELKYGFPQAEETELRKVIELNGFKLVENDTKKIKIWSPSEGYCFTYNEAVRRDDTTTPALISEISSADSAACQL